MRKASVYSVLAAMLIAGLTAAPALAERHGSFSVPENCRVVGQNLPAGTYDLTYEQLQGDQVQVKFYRGSELAATVTGTLVQNQPRVSQDAIVLRQNAAGSMDLVEIRMRGTTDRIQLATS